MKEEFIAVLDSGIGGISLLKDLIENFPTERFLYFGDNNNAPYGNKNVNRLMQLTMKNIDYIKHYNIKALILGCNTLSVNLYRNIKEYAKVPTFGVFPPVEKCLVDGKKTLLLSTCSTADCYRHYKGLGVVGFENLVKDIENNIENLKFLDFESNLRCSKGKFNGKKGFYDVVILGCTHYLFIKNKIFDHFCPKKIISGNDFTISFLKKHFNNIKTSVKHKQFEPLFIGECADKNKRFYLKSGQNISNLQKNIQI